MPEPRTVHFKNPHILSWGLRGPDGYEPIGLCVHDGETLDIDDIPPTVKTVTLLAGGTLTNREGWWGLSPLHCKSGRLNVRFKDGPNHRDLDCIDNA